ncbi:unnamed protein product, partial [Rotaria magnacalcarata]
MLRTRLYVAILVLIFAVHSSQAANCTSASFEQPVTAALLASSLINGTQYASSTTDQLTSMFSNDLGENAAGINYAVQQTGDQVTFSYTITFACNDTIATTLSNGKQQTTQVKSKLNKTTVENCVSAGLTDRSNQISLKAEQVKAGLTDTTIDYNMGGQNYFEWTIQTTTSSYLNASTASSFKNANDFPNALANSFRTALSSIYHNKISNVTFISLATPNAQYVLKFRLYFVDPITPNSLRTQIIANIQTANYQALRNYFPSIAKTARIPTSSSISAPKPVNLKSTKTVSLQLQNNANSAVSTTRDSKIGASTTPTNNKPNSQSTNKQSGSGNARSGVGAQGLGALLGGKPTTKSSKPDNSVNHSGERRKPGPKSDSGETKRQRASGIVGSGVGVGETNKKTSASRKATTVVGLLSTAGLTTKFDKPNTSKNNLSAGDKLATTTHSGGTTKQSGPLIAGSGVGTTVLGGKLSASSKATTVVGRLSTAGLTTKSGKPDTSTNNFGEDGKVHSITHAGDTKKQSGSGVPAVVTGRRSSESWESDDAGSSSGEGFIESCESDDSGISSGEGFSESWESDDSGSSSGEESSESWQYDDSGSSSGEESSESWQYDDYG